MEYGSVGEEGEEEVGEGTESNQVADDIKEKEINAEEYEEIPERENSDNFWGKHQESVGALCAFICATCLAVSYICIQVKGTMFLIIHRKAKEIIRLVASVCLPVHLSVIVLSFEPSVSVSCCCFGRVHVSSRSHL